MSTDVEALFREHGTAVLGYLARRVADPADAADLLSEAILIAWRRRAEVPHPPADRLWLYGVARNLLANHRRSSRRRDAATMALQTLVTDVVPPMSTELLDVKAALDRLDEVDRELICLSAWEGLSSNEIADVTGMPASTVRYRLSKAREKLQSDLSVVES